MLYYVTFAWVVMSLGKSYCPAAVVVGQLRKARQAELRTSRLGYPGEEEGKGGGLLRH